MNRRHLAFPATALCVSAFLSAQTPVLRIQGAENLTINDRGDIAYILDFGPNGKQLRVEPVLGPGPFSVALSAGISFPSLLPSFPDALIDDLGAFALDGSGQLVLSMELSDPALPSLNEGLYRINDVPLTNGDAIAHTSLSPGSSWLQFSSLVKTSPSGRILLSGTVSDAAIPGFADEVLASFELDGNGDVQDLEIFAVESGPVPNLPGFVVRQAGLPNRQTDADINDAGDVLWTVRMQSPGVTSERALFLNDELLIQQRQPSPIPSQNWGGIFGPMDLNEQGDWLVQAQIGSGPQNGVLVLNGNVIVREGDGVPGTATTIFRFASQTPVGLTADARPVYQVELFGGGTAILVGDEIVARTGETQLGGLLLEEIRDARDTLSLSANGRFLAFRGLLEFGVDVYGVIDLGIVRPLVACQPNTGELSLDGAPVLGNTIFFSADNAPSPTAEPYLMISSAPWPSAMPPCGLTVSSGELLINFGGADPLLVQPMTLSTNSASVYISTSPVLVNLPLYAQGIFVDPGGPEPLRLTNAMEIVIGS